MTDASFDLASREGIRNAADDCGDAVKNWMNEVAESGRGNGRAQLLAKKGASGRMQRPPELVPIPGCCVK